MSSSLWQLTTAALPACTPLWTSCSSSAALQLQQRPSAAPASTGGPSLRVACPLRLSGLATLQQPMGLPSEEEAAHSSAPFSPLSAHTLNICTDHPFSLLPLSLMSLQSCFLCTKKGARSLFLSRFLPPLENGRPSHARTINLGEGASPLSARWSASAGRGELLTWAPAPHGCQPWASWVSAQALREEGEERERVGRGERRGAQRSQHNGQNAQERAP